MQLSRRFLTGSGGALLLLVALALLSGAGQAVDNSSRVDAGPSFEVRVNEDFDIVPGAVFEEPPAVEALDYWWDTDNRTDTTPHDGNPTNDQDQFGAIFHYAGFDRVGTYAFTLWVNYSDGRLVNGTRLITVVENQAPIITPGLAPSGVTGSPVTFAVTVNDADSSEVDLIYEWDFDVGFDSDSNGVPDDDIDSTLKTNVQHTYTAEGTYAAKLTVRDDYGDETLQYINAIITRPPGVCEREVGENAVGNSFTENVTVRKLCWASYHIKVYAGRHYSYTVEVSNGIPVFVMVQFGKEQYDSYKLRGSTLAFVPEWSTVPERVNSTTVTFVPEADGIAYVTIDNGYLYAIDPGHESSLTVTVQDADRNNLLANIPVWVYIVIVAGAIGAGGFFFARAYIASAEVRRAQKAKQAVETQEKAQAKSELDRFLSNPEEAMQRKVAPPPPPVPPPGAVAAAGVAAAAPRAGPRPSGPQMPAGYTPPPPPPPRPAPVPAPAPAPTAGPRPGAGPQPAGPAPPMACPSCQTPTEVGWAACPNCGAAL